jgi:carboxymethylenebutenolidase
VHGVPAIDAILLRPDRAGAGSCGVLVLHSWWGLTDDVRTTCRSLADAGFTALAPDLFGGERPADVGAARTALGGLDPSTLTREVVAAAGALQDATGAKLAPIGVVGFGMGGSLALWLACRLPGVVGAVVTYYGTQHLDFAPLRAAVLGHFAEEDDEVSEDDRSYTEALLGLAGNEASFHVHPGTRHGFAEAGDPAHDPTATAVAWDRTLAHLRAALHSP